MVASASPARAGRPGAPRERPRGAGASGRSGPRSPLRRARAASTRRSGRAEPRAARAVVGRHPLALPARDRHGSTHRPGMPASSPAYFGVTVRCLVAIPLLVIAEAVAHAVPMRLVPHFVSSQGCLELIVRSGELLQRVVEVDALCCPRCGARTRLIAATRPAPSASAGRDGEFLGGAPAWEFDQTAPDEDDTDWPALCAPCRHTRRRRRVAQLGRPRPGPSGHSCPGIATPSRLLRHATRRSPRRALAVLPTR